MKETILKAVGKWLFELYEKVAEDPIKNSFLLIVSLFIIFYMGQALYSSFGIITFVGYIFACIYGITKIVDNPERTLIWGIGFVIGAVAFKVFVENFLPSIGGFDTASIIGGLVILYVVIVLYLKSRELKNA